MRRRRRRRSISGLPKQKYDLLSFALRQSRRPAFSLLRAKKDHINVCIQEY
jgi:hypothetical protein